MSELSQFVAIDILTHAIHHLEDAYRSDQDTRWPYWVGNFDAREVLIKNLSRALDEVSVWDEGNY